MKIISFLPFLLISLASFAQKRTEMTVHFEFDKDDIRPTDARLLDSLVATFPSKAQNISIEIYGHCDTRGSDEYNDGLSLKRVKAVEKYLLARAVELSSISKEQGYGKQRPIGVAHMGNRRVELITTIQEEKIMVREKPVEKPVEQPAEKTITKILEDTAIKVGTTLALKNLNFVGGNHFLLPRSMPVLEELLSVMKNNPKLVIAIEGHICCIPGSNDGVDLATRRANLSEARAQTVYDYLRENGIASRRLSYKGFGHQFPIYPYPEKSEAEQEMNRRVEIRIIRK